MSEPVISDEKAEPFLQCGCKSCRENVKKPGQRLQRLPRYRFERSKDMSAKKIKPLLAWAVEYKPGKLWMWTYGTRAEAEATLEPWYGERLVRVRITPVTPKRKVKR